MFRKSSKVRNVFQQRFATPKPLAEVDVKVSIKPRQKQPRKNKYSLSAFSPDNGQAFWEELRDSQRAGKSTQPKLGPVIDTTVASPQDITEDSLINSRQETDVSIASEPVTEPTLTVMRDPATSYLEPHQSLLEMNPQKLAVQQDLVRAKHAGGILVLVDANRGRMDAVNLATALHRIAKITVKKGPTNLQFVRSDCRTTILVEDLGDVVKSSEIGPVWASNVLWALVKMDLVELAWLPTLIEKMTVNIAAMPLEQVGCNLYSIAELEKRNSKVLNLEDLKELLIASAVSRRHEFSNPHQLVSICTSLARLGRAERLLFKSLSDSVLSQIDHMSVGDLTSVLWAFTTLRITDSLLYAKIQGLFESGGKISECSKRDLVDICWSLAKSRTSGSDESLSEFLKFTIAPVVRQHMMDYTVRELCTLVWSFATAEVIDPDFYNDLAHALLPKAQQMNAHDVSSVVWALSSVHYRHGDFFGSLKHQALRLKSQFTPLQLSRVIYGLGAGNVSDKRVMAELVDLASKKMHLLYTQNIVEILIGLNYANMLDETTCGPFWKALASQTSKVSGRDAVQLLSVLGATQVAYPETAVVSRNKDLVSSLQEIISSRFNCSGRWIPSGYDVVDLVKGIADLRLTNIELLEKALLHLSRVYKSPSFSADLFLRFLDAVTALLPQSPQITLVKKLALLKEKGIQTALEKLSQNLVGRTSSLDIAGASAILGMYARIGFADSNVERFAETLTEAIDRETPLGNVAAQVAVATCAALTELQLMPDWVFGTIERMPASLVAELDSDSLIDLVWTRLALADDPALVDTEILSAIGKSYVASGKMPSHLFRAKQICQSLANFSDTYWSEFRNDCLGISPVVKLPIGAKEKRRQAESKSIIRAIDKYSSLVSFSLSQLDIKHQHEYMAIPNLYSVTASVGHSVCLDVIGADDVISPRGTRFSGSRILKNIHLAQAGWTLVNVPMRTVQSALESNSLVPVVADLIAPYNEKGKVRVSLRKMTNAASQKVVDDILID